jgi:Flp pilus assembly protein TadG
MRAQSPLRTQHGAIIIQVAFALLALIAFNAFVVDLGMMWLSRRQAQNTVDAAALAGAISLANDGGSKTEAAKSAHHWAAVNPILSGNNSTANVDVTMSGSSGTCGAGCTVASIPPCGTQDGCVRVDVFRNMPDRTGGAPRGAAIPMFFGHLVGVNQQGVRATATAWTAAANTTECLKPWAVADKWRELRNGASGGWPNGEKPWSPTDTFDKWRVQGNNVSLYPDPRDMYIPPTNGTPGTGFTPATDIGLQLMLKLGTGNNNDVISSGWFKALELPCPNGNSGADCYRYNIANCTTQAYSIGDTLSVSTQQGQMVGPTEQGVNGSQQIQGLVQKDPGAQWVKDNPTAPYVPGQPQPGRVVGSNYASSPRIVPVALIDIDDFLATSPNGRSTVRIVNIMGFFIEGTCGGQVTFQLEAYNSCQQNNGAVVGRLVRYTGMQVGTAPSVGNAAFLNVIQLVR